MNYIALFKLTGNNEFRSNTGIIEVAMVWQLRNVI